MNLRRTTPRRTTPRRTSRVRRLKRRTRSRAARPLRGGSRRRHDNGYSYKTIAALGTAGVAGALALRALTKKPNAPTPPTPPTPSSDTEAMEQLSAIKIEVSNITIDLSNPESFRDHLNAMLTRVYCIVACNEENEKKITWMEYLISAIIRLLKERSEDLARIEIRKARVSYTYNDTDLQSQTKQLREATNLADINYFENKVYSAKYECTSPVIMDALQAVADARLRKDELRAGKNVEDVKQTLEEVIRNLTVNDSSDYCYKEDPYSFDPNNYQKLLATVKNAQTTDEQHQKYRLARELVRVYSLFKNWWVEKATTTEGINSNYATIRQRFSELKVSTTNAEKKQRLLLEHLLIAKQKHFGEYIQHFVIVGDNPDRNLVRAALQNVAELNLEIWTTTCKPQA